MIDISSNLSPEKLHPWLVWRKWRRRPPVVERWSGGAWSLEWCLLYQHDDPCWPQRTPVHACHHETPANHRVNLIRSYPAKSTVLLRSVLLGSFWLFSLAFLHPLYENFRLIFIICCNAYKCSIFTIKNTVKSLILWNIITVFCFTVFYNHFVTNFRTFVPFFKTLNTKL